MELKDSEKPRVLRVFEIEECVKLFKGLKVPACLITESHQIVDEQSVLRRLRALTLNGASDGNACSCCGVGPFETRAQQTAHYKQHWHTHNLKRKLFGKPPLTLGDFNLRQDDSSVSGSDSETEETNRRTNPVSDLFAAATRHCKAFYQNKVGQIICVYRCILHHRKEELSTDGDGSAWVERCHRLPIPVFQRWAVIMISAGHFAGAVFSGSVPVVHKTLHTYVTRRGQGHAQATRDNKAGHAPRSAGANLRRQNQAQFVEYVQEILASWEKDLMDCSLVLYRAVGPMNQAALFGKISPLKRDDLRIRALPFPTRKPSYKEVKRVHDTVACIEVYATMELFQKALIATTSKQTNKSNADINADRPKKQHRQTLKQRIDRAKSRERIPRELPMQVTSSEDEGPCYIDSETPAGWIKILSEQCSNGVINNSRKDLLINDTAIASCHSSDSEDGKTKGQATKKKPVEFKPVRKSTPKIPTKIKKLWQMISDKEMSCLGTILEAWEEADLETACNTQDPVDGNTALHKAAIAEKPEMVTQLLTVGGDPCVKNYALQTPYAASPHQDTRVAFRLFQAAHPDKYNYAKSQIPGPATPEVLEQEKERKVQQKKMKRQRDKEKQIEKIKTNHYVMLSDADKVRADERRCFLCGGSVPKRPFEYSVYKFCSIRCMQNHRNLRPIKKSA